MAARMYRPPHFREDDPERLDAFVSAHPLATLVAHVAGGLVANHVPLLMVRDEAGRRVLRGHVARANELWRALSADAPVLAIFQGAESYVTPAWYAAKAATGEVVPTWNYAVVHAHGTIRFFDERDRLHALVSSLTDEHERPRTQPWAVDDAPTPYVDRMLSAIVGLEIEVTRYEGKFKASQNRTAEDRARIASGLEADGRSDDERAELVQSK
jgi:transcriptional regulator